VGIQLVWLKRDLRIQDHGPLAEAAARGPVCALYLYEPPLWQRPEHDASHLHFVNDSLAELDQALRSRGGRLTFRVGRAVPTLQALHRELAGHGGIEAIWSHQETGLRWTFSRDRAVARWAREQGVAWHELGQDGVCRPHPSRDGWARRWTRAMARPSVPAPERITDVSSTVPGWDHQGPRTAPELGMGPSTADLNALQPAGESAALALLDDFMAGRALGYRAGMSSPLSAWDACSRLSPHLAWGTLSTRRAWQLTRLRMRQLATERHPDSAELQQDLSAFTSRLRWRGHFMQKLEDEPRLEHENLHPAVDGVRERAFDERRFQAWARGRTGWPLVDACMRSLHTRRWINFRMRAMLISVASYPLWLHWRRPAVHLAAHFLDFEPGIHFAQVQMQAGTTGINRLRIYDPIKQAREQDPDGTFIRRWVPELRGVPDAFIHQPERMDTATQRRAGCTLGRDYPLPLVDARTASALARRKLQDLRSRSQARAQAREIHHRHGSRRRAPRSRPAFATDVPR